MNNFWKEPKQKSINKKKIIIFATIILLLLIILTITIIYIKNENAREWIDKNIFRKEISQNNLPFIELKEGENQEIIAFNKYIGILSKNALKIYNSTGTEEESLTLEITKPIFCTNTRHLAIAEDKGKKVYLVTDKDIVWERTVEGNISQVTVNKNGYVAVTITDTNYKAVIIIFDNQGNPLFRTFLSATRSVDVSISNDNKYLAIAEIDTSSTVIQSNIKIISIEKGQNDTENSVIKHYKGENNELLTNIEYHEKNRLVCMYTDKIKVIKTDETIEELTNSEDKKITFESIELANHVISIEEKSSGLFTADSIINIINTQNHSTSSYTTNAVAKEIYTSNNIIALNLGVEVEFVDINGWLVKRYIAEQEITQVVLANSIAGIIYRDKIEIVNL